MIEAKVYRPTIEQGLTAEDSSQVKTPNPEIKRHSRREFLRIVAITAIGIATTASAESAQPNSDFVTNGGTEPGGETLQYPEFGKLKPCPENVELKFQDVTAVNRLTNGTIAVPQEYGITHARLMWSPGEPVEVIQPDATDLSNKKDLFTVYHRWDKPGDKYPTGIFMQGNKLVFVCRSEQPVEVYNTYDWQIPEQTFEVGEDEASQEFRFNVNTDLPPELMEEGQDYIVGAVGVPHSSILSRGGDLENGDVAYFYVDGQEQWGRFNLHGDRDINDENINWKMSIGGDHILQPENLEGRTDEVVLGIHRPDATYINGEDVTGQFPPTLSGEFRSGATIYWMPKSDQPKLIPNQDTPAIK